MIDPLNFYYDNDVLLEKVTELISYGLRSFANVNFYSSGNCDPIIEVDKFINDTKGEYFDPLFALVIIPIGDKFNTKLYYCHNISQDYVELADYGVDFGETMVAAYPGLADLGQGLADYLNNGLNDNLMKMLKDLLNYSLVFLGEKIEGLRSL